MSHLSPSRERVSKPPLTPSPFPSLEYPLHPSTQWQMNLSRPPHADRDDYGDFDADINACQPNDGCAHGSSERPVASDEGYNSHGIDLNHDISSHFDQSDATYNNSLGLNYMGGDGSLDTQNWLGFSISPLSPVPDATLPWTSSMVRQPYLADFISNVGNVLPSSGPSSATASTLAPQPALVPARAPTELLPPTAYKSFVKPTTEQGKRAWSERRTLSESDDGDDDDQYVGTQYDPYKKKTTAPPPRMRLSEDGNNLGYPQLIPDDLKKPEDNDFEDSCEFCPFYLMEPFQFIQKPWNSCSKPRAEYSHTISHACSDHGFIRGQHPQRPGQRFVTRCALRETSVKGKNKCEHCSKPGRWTQDDPDDPADETHFASALCLRCYTQFPTRADLFNHHKELNICTYREDMPLKEKMKILYITFASSSAPPKFHPPVNKPRENGARKRRLKGGQGQNTSSPATRRQNNGRQPPGPVRHIHPQPTSSQLNSPLAASLLSPPQMTSPAPTLASSEHNDPMPSFFQSPPHVPYGSQPTDLLCAGMGQSYHDSGPFSFSPFTMGQLNHGFPNNPMPSQFMPNIPNGQYEAQNAGKPHGPWDLLTDSGFGSMLDEDLLNMTTGLGPDFDVSFNMDT
ncbi:hypothetical protein B0J13DRAFT_144169 [Dactylonectria estremocensis]|uniref:Uncharacterized protein n=1 Tax=Dactylonectria estremocensis TaxID=1079267 RepID=A0A9P9DV16_9HYPO|nr:hypothetical protein B0J13DRAFT_144169 [Dactylonectria estremocensis]